MMISPDERVNLTPIEVEDLETIRSWRNSPNIQRYLREYRLFSKTQKAEWYNSMVNNNKFEMFLIRDNQTCEAVGVCGLTYIDWVNRHADLHIYTGKQELWIDELYCPRTMKLMLNYAFKFLNLNKVWAEIYEIDNKKIDFFIKNDFKVDATLREHYYYNGKYYNSHILSLLKCDYE